MSKRIRGFAAAASAVALMLVGVTGCSEDGPSDAKACEEFNKTIASADVLFDDDDDSEAMERLKEGALESAAKAETPELKTLFENLGSGRPGTEDPDFAEIEFMLDFFDVGEACEAAGVTIKAYKEAVEELEAEGITIDDARELYEMLKGFDESGLLDEDTDLDLGEPLDLDYDTEFDDAALQEEAAEDAELEALYEGCKAGDMEACDELYWEAPLGSDLELFANLCGGERTAEDASPFCVDLER